MASMPKFNNSKRREASNGIAVADESGENNEDTISRLKPKRREASSRDAATDEVDQQSKGQLKWYK